MGKKKERGAYNDFLDGERLSDNTNITTTLQSASDPAQDVTFPPSQTGWKAAAKVGNPKGTTTKPQLTHFLCLPLVNSESRSRLQETLDIFCDELRGNSVIPSNAVRPIGTLHLTLGVMALDKSGLDGAKNLLQELDLKRLLLNPLHVEENAREPTPAQPEAEVQIPVTEPKDFTPLSISLEALVPMQQARKTSILYAEPKDVSARLYPFASALKDEFTTKRFMVDENRALRLHATIVNSVYAKSGSKVRGPGAKSFMKFDATNLIERHRDTVWAEVIAIDRVQICKMGAQKIKDEQGNIVDEKYEVVAEKLI
jgi:activating signal cointegrator complex subunit 1